MRDVEWEVGVCMDVWRAHKRSSTSNIQTFENDSTPSIPHLVLDDSSEVGDKVLVEVEEAGQEAAALGAVEERGAEGGLWDGERG